MRPFTSTISLREALDLVARATVPVARVDRVPIDAADGRVLAVDLDVVHDVPPFDRAAMDGYAVRAADTAGASAEMPVTLRIAGTAYTGQAGAALEQAGACVTIATGAPIPAGADAVVMVEHTSGTTAAQVEIRAAVAAGQHVVRRGSDMRAGSRVLSAGWVLTPARVGAIAALGRVDVDVYARPRVFVASTGDELVPPGRTLEAGQIYEINRFTLAPVIRAHGGEAIAGATAADAIDALQGTLDEALSARADLIVLSGGSSVGDRDLMADAVRDRGDLIFHGIAVKPGKPTLFGRLREGPLVLGMPGNPTSCLSNAYILLIPLLRRLARLPAWRPETRDATLAADVPNTSDRHTFFPVRLEGDRALPAFKGSGDITSLAHADGYIEVDAHVTRVAAGSAVRVTLF